MHFKDCVFLTGVDEHPKYFEETLVSTFLQLLKEVISNPNIMPVVRQSIRACFQFDNVNRPLDVTLI